MNSYLPNSHKVPYISRAFGVVVDSKHKGAKNLKKVDVIDLPLDNGDVLMVERNKQASDLDHDDPNFRFLKHAGEHNRGNCIHSVSVRRNS